MWGRGIKGNFGELGVREGDLVIFFFFNKIDISDWIFQLCHSRQKPHLRSTSGRGNFRRGVDPSHPELPGLHLASQVKTVRPGLEGRAQSVSSVQSNLLLWPHLWSLSPSFKVLRICEARGPSQADFIFKSSVCVFFETVSTSKA